MAAKDPIYLTGDVGAINAFIDKFDVRVFHSSCRDSTWSTPLFFACKAQGKRTARLQNEQRQKEKLT